MSSSTDEVMAMFGHLTELATKRTSADASLTSPAQTRQSQRRSDEQPQASRPGRGRGRGGKNAGRAGGHPADTTAPQDLRSLVGSLQRLVLQHEDQLSLLRLDRGYVLTLLNGERAGDGAILPGLVAAALEWRQRKEKGEVTTSLRETLLLLFLSTLIKRLQLFLESPEAIESATKVKWVTGAADSLEWNKMEWSPTLKVEEPAPSLGALKTVEVQKLLTEALALVGGRSGEASILHRFHATRPLGPTMQGETVTFLLEISSRGEAADRLWTILNSLAKCSCFSLVGSKLRQERIRRSPLAQALS